jgi:hypothetical protein
MVMQKRWIVCKQWNVAPAAMKVSDERKLQQNT